MGESLCLSESLVRRGQLRRAGFDTPLEVRGGVLQRSPRTEAFAHDRGEEEGHQGHGGVERLERQHLAREAEIPERSPPLDRRPRREQRDEERRRCGARLLEPPGRPAEDREQQERDRQLARHDKRRDGEQDRGEHDRLGTFQPRGIGCSRIVVSVSRTGATTRIPIASPAHHTDQAPRYSSPTIAPDAKRAVVPTVALIVVLANAAITIEPVPEPIELRPEPETVQHRDRGDRRRRVPRRSDERREDRFADRDVDHERRDRDAGPETAPEEEQTDACDPSGGHSGVMFSPTRASSRLSRAARK